MARIRNTNDIVDTSHDEEDADSDAHSVTSSNSSHCNLKACSASMDLHSSSITRLSPSASSSSLRASLSKTSLTRALSNTCLQAVTSGTELDVTAVGSSFVPDLASKTVERRTEPWINYGQLGTNSLSSSSSLIFPKAPDPLFKQNFVANWITGVSNSQPEGPNIVPLYGTTKDDKYTYQQHGGGDIRWLDNLGRGYLNDRQDTVDVSMDTMDDKPSVIGRIPFGFERHSTDWFTNNGGSDSQTNAMETDAFMPSAACYMRPASFMYDKDVAMTSSREQTTPQSVLDISVPMDLDDPRRNISPWTQNASSFFTTQRTNGISMIIDDEKTSEVNYFQPMVVDSMQPQTNMGYRLSISQSKTNIEMYSPTSSVEMISPASSSIEMLSPTPSSIEMLSPTPSSIKMLSPTPSSIKMLSPTPSLEMRSPNPSVSLGYTPKVLCSQSTTVFHTDTFKSEQKSWLATTHMNISGAATTELSARITDTKRKPANKRKREQEDDDEESPAKRRVITKAPCDNICRYLKPFKRQAFLRTRNK